MTHPIAFHGLSAYSRLGTPEAVVGAANKLESALFTNGAEICVADRPIGPVGVVVQGVITYAWAKDVYSVIDGTGHRVPQDHTTWDEVPFTVDPDHDLWVEWCYRSLTEPNRLLRLPYSTHDGVDIPRMRSRPFVQATQRHHASRHYAEGWLAHPQVVSLWVKTHVPRDPHHPFRQAVDRLKAAFQTCAVLDVHGVSRIWELYPSSDPAIEDAWAGLLGDDEKDWW